MFLKKGKILNQPVYKLLGGATVNKIPAYASMLGYNVLDMKLVGERLRLYKAVFIEEGKNATSRSYNK